MNTKDIRKLSDKELEKLALEKRAAVRQFRFNVTGSKVKNMHEGRTERRLLARLLTERGARNRAGA